MKGILEFDLLEEKKEHLAATMGSKLADMLYEINYTIRRRYLKYMVLTDEQTDVLQKVFDDISEEINIDLEEIR